jgi:outer membrane protein assembly factor BamD (BamD/ComL family)
MPAADPAPAAPPPAPAAPPSPSAEDLYAQAEASLASRDPATADRALAQIVALSPPSALLDQALYERARIAYARHAWAEARRDLDALASLSASPLVEPGRYLACRIAVEARDADAPRCLADFRAAYPRSAHDLDALALLAQLADDCTAAHTYIDELAARYPDAPLTAAWRARCPEPPP